MKKKITYGILIYMILFILYNNMNTIDLEQIMNKQIINIFIVIVSYVLSARI